MRKRYWWDRAQEAEQRVRRLEAMNDELFILAYPNSFAAQADKINGQKGQDSGTGGNIWVWGTGRRCCEAGSGGPEGGTVVAGLPGRGHHPDNRSDLGVTRAADTVTEVEHT